MYNALAILGLIGRMVKQYHVKWWWVSVGLVLISLGLWLFLMREFRLDDSFITYRYARNLARGWGLVYNLDTPVLSTTAPLYAVILALLSGIINDFHVLGGFVGALCIGAGGGLIGALLPRETAFSVRIWASLVYTLSSPLWLALGMETPLWIMLVLLAVYCSQHERWLAAGLLIGGAILTRPDAALPGILLGGAALLQSVSLCGTTRRWWQSMIIYSAAAALPVMIFGVWAWLTYGSPFPATLSAKSAQSVLGITGFGVFVDAWGGLRLIVESLLEQSLLYLAFLPLLVFGLRGGSVPLVLLVGWGVLHFAAYVVLGVAPYRWYYVPLLPGVVALAAGGLHFLLKKQAWVGAVFAVLVIGAQGTSLVQIASYFERGGERQTMLPVVDWRAYREAGEWLNAHAAPDAFIGVAEVGQLGFYADRTMTDYLGLLQPEVSHLLKRGDLYSWLVGYAPEYLVFQRFGGKVGLALYNYFIEYDGWFNANYHEAAKFDDPRYVLGPVVIYQRTLPVNRQAETHLAAGDFQILRLTGYAVDVQGAAARVRLDWQKAGVLPENLHITLVVLGLPEDVRFDGDYATDYWGEVESTWHSLILPEAILPGQYTISATINLPDGAYISLDIGYMDILLRE